MDFPRSRFETADAEEGCEMHGRACDPQLQEPGVAAARDSAHFLKSSAVASVSHKGYTGLFLLRALCLWTSAGCYYRVERVEKTAWFILYKVIPIHFHGHPLHARAQLSASVGLTSNTADIHLSNDLPSLSQSRSGSLVRFKAVFPAAFFPA